MSSRGVSRRVFASAAACAAVAVGVPALRAQSRLDVSKLVIAVAGRQHYAQLPLTVAEQRGYFRAEGLTTQFHAYVNESTALQSVIGGGAHIGAGGFEQVLTAAARGQMLQAFALQSRSPAVALGISLRTLPDYHAVSDLRGRKIGVTGLGTAAHAVAHLLTTQAGLKKGEVTYVSLPSMQEALAAIRFGQIDALCHLDPAMTLLEQRGEVHIVADTRTLSGVQRWLGTLMPATCLYAGTEFLEKSHQVVQALGRAMVRSLKWLQTAGPGDLMKLVPEEYLLGDRALYLAAFNNLRESLSPDGLMPVNGAQTAFKLLAEVDPTLKQNRIDLSRTYTNEFVLAGRANPSH